jgi:mannose-6-phosphate isomerase-like protein (cupin superfamily)
MISRNAARPKFNKLRDVRRPQEGGLGRARHAGKRPVWQYAALQRATDGGPKMSEILVLPSGVGRSYEMGKMQAVFKADEDETSQQYAVSEWWLEPGCDGPGAHSHEVNEELFYVLEGTVNLLIGDKWIDAAPGTFVRIPAGITHDFRNTTKRRAGLLNIFIPGGFERNMPAIVDWFAQQEAPETT